MTAIEWLIKEYFGDIENCSPNFRNKIQQAKEMEKQQIINADLNAYINGSRAQAKLMYSEEDMREAFSMGRLGKTDMSFKEWFEKFKKFKNR